jgi:hypothetical protein
MREAPRSGGWRPKVGARDVPPCRYSAHQRAQLRTRRRRIELGLKRPELLPIIDALIAEVTVVPVAALEPLLAKSELALRDAVASRNGSVRDAHVLALAWSIDGDVWTTDRDFAGTGVATWSTPNLMRGLAEATRART